MTPDRDDRLRSLARTLEQLELISLVRASSSDTWIGPTADAVSEALQRHRNTILQSVDALRVVARRLEPRTFG